MTFSVHMIPSFVFSPPSPPSSLEIPPPPRLSHLHTCLSPPSPPSLPVSSLRRNPILICYLGCSHVGELTNVDHDSFHSRHVPLSLPPTSLHWSLVVICNLRQLGSNLQQGAAGNGRNSAPSSPIGGFKSLKWGLIYSTGLKFTDPKLGFYHPGLRLRGCFEPWRYLQGSSLCQAPALCTRILLDIHCVTHPSLDLLDVCRTQAAWRPLVWSEPLHPAL